MTVLHMERGRVYTGIFESEFGENKILIRTDDHATYKVIGMIGKNSIVCEYDIVDVLDEVKVDEQ